MFDHMVCMYKILKYTGLDFLKFYCDSTLPAFNHIHTSRNHSTDSIKKVFSCTGASNLQTTLVMTKGLKNIVVI